MTLAIVQDLGRKPWHMHSERIVVSAHGIENEGRRLETVQQPSPGFVKWYFIVILSFLVSCSSSESALVERMNEMNLGGTTDVLGPQFTLLKNALVVEVMVIVRQI